MSIPDEEIALVRQATDIVGLIGEHLALRKAGRRWVGLCPFHQEKSPSFSVNAEEGLYHCFGCQASGDAITFLRTLEHLDFVEAVERLAARAHITLHDTGPAADSAARRRRDDLLETMESAVTFYHEQLLDSPEAAPARAYVGDRGYGEPTIEKFRLGYSPQDFDTLEKALRRPRDLLVDAGLGFVNRRGRFQDGFRGRLLFPIFDSGGRAIAVGGRLVPDLTPAGETDPPKYKNSPETPIYAKRRTLYGLNWAKAGVIATGEIVVCEGYTDVIGCFRAGIERAVATCGTALGEEHFGTLRKFARRIVLAFDADGAGTAGAERVYAWERSHDVDVAVAALPAGTDPGELARSDPAALGSAVAGAQPFLGFRVGRILSTADLATGEGRARAFETAVAAVAEHPNELVRDHYLVLVAERTGVDLTRARSLLSRAMTARRRAPARQPPGPGSGPSAGSSGAGVAPGSARSAGSEGGIGSHGDARPHGDARSHDGTGDAATTLPDATGDAAPTPPSTSTTRPPAVPSASSPATVSHSLVETEALRIALADPDSVVGMLHECLFASEELRRCFQALESSDWDVHGARATAGEPVASLLGKLAVEEPSASGADVWRRMIELATVRALKETEVEIRRFPERFADVESLRVVIRRAMEDLRDVRDPDRASMAGELLLGWLVERARDTMIHPPAPTPIPG